MPANDESHLEQQQQPRGQQQPGQAPGGGWVPIPDPTVLTDAAISRATEVFRREIRAVRETLETRIDGTDAERKIMWDRLRELPALYEVATNHLRDEMIQRIAQDREVLTQRLTDIDTARNLTRQDADADRERIRNEMHVSAQKLQELIDQRSESMDQLARSVREIIETRLAGMDEATKLLATNVDKVPYAILQEAGNLKAFIMSRIEDVSHANEEKFAAVHEKFASTALALDAAMVAQEKAVAAAMEASGKAVDKAEIANEKRFESVNEFRAQQGDIIAQFLTRNEYSAAHQTVVDAVTELRSQLDGLSGTVVPRNETEAWRGALASKLDDGVRGLTERIAALELRLTSRLDTSAGQTIGAEQYSVQSRAERTEQRLSQGAIVSLVVAVVIIAGFVLTLVTTLHR
jgi:hypothetical protein